MIITLMNLNLNKHYIFHHHHGYPGMKYSYNYINSLKNKLKEKKIKFLFFTIIRDPYKRINSSINYNKCITNNQIINYINLKNNYIIKYILYNKDTCLYNNLPNILQNNSEYDNFKKIRTIFDIILDINEIYKLKPILELIFNNKLLPMPSNKINTTNYIVNLNINHKLLIKDKNKLDIKFIDYCKLIK